MIVIDSKGEWIEYVIGQQNAMSLGNLANTLYGDSSIARTVMDHPYASGAAIGIGSGLTAYVASAGVTYGLTELGIIGTQANSINKETLNSINSNVTRITNTINDHLQTKDYTGFARDLSGNPVWSNSMQRYYNHYKEVMDARRGLVSGVQKLTNIMQNNKLDSKAINTVNQAINQANRHIEKIDQILKSH